MTQFQYHPMHMHIHSCFQPGASMAMQMQNAKKLGMEYIWITDHDSRMGAKKTPVTGISFEKGSRMIQESEKDFYGFELTEYDEKANLTERTEQKKLLLCAKANENSCWQNAGVHFVSSRTRHTASLLNGITLEIGIETEGISSDARLILAVKLSQRPPECIPARMLYVLGNIDGLESAHTQILPLEIRNGKTVLSLSEDVSREEDIGGLDNTFDTVQVILQVRNGAELNVSVKDLKIHTEYSYKDIQLQRKQVAAEIGNKIGVTPFVSFEISSAGEHKNCFSTDVPLIDYETLGFQVTHREAVSHVKKHSGIFAVNHPLAIEPLKRHHLSETEKLRVVAKMAAELLANRADGATLIEVGFPMGRNNFTLEEYTMLWDLLSQGGLFLCGYGSSDSHRDNNGWFDGNNFVAYVAADATQTYPIPEKTFIASMKRGNVYTGDPCVLQGQISFETEDGFPMGTVFDTKDTQKTNIRFCVDHVKNGWEFRLIENGNVLYRETLTEGYYEHHSVLEAGLDAVRFQRAEMYDENGRCILLTNPIYLVDTAQASFDIPTERLAKGRII